MQHDAQISLDKQKQHPYTSVTKKDVLINIPHNSTGKLGDYSLTEVRRTQ